MKTTVSREQFYQAFADANRKDNFSSGALEALFDYLEEYEASCNTEIELDVVALCCEYAEGTVEEIADEYSIDLSDCEDDDDDAKTEAVRDFLDKHTSVVGETSDGFVYACF